MFTACTRPSQWLLFAAIGLLLLAPTGTRSLGATAVAIKAPISSQLRREGIEAVAQHRYAEAMALFRRASRQGDADATYDVGCLYYSGLGVPKDFRRAWAWFGAAAKGGSHKAKYFIGLLYLRGYGVARNDQVAKMWFLRAAKQGDHSAEYAIGRLYLKGTGLKKSNSSALRWFLRAARGGNTLAMVAAAALYQRQSPPNLQKAVAWLKKAAAAGDGKAMEKLGGFYFTGKGVRQSYPKAISWLKRSAAAGNLIAKQMLPAMESLRHPLSARRGHGQPAAAVGAQDIIGPVPWGMYQVKRGVGDCPNIITLLPTKTGRHLTAISVGITSSRSGTVLFTLTGGGLMGYGVSVSSRAIGHHGETYAVSVNGNWRIGGSLPPQTFMYKFRTYKFNKKTDSWVRTDRHPGTARQNGNPLAKPKK